MKLYREGSGKISKVTESYLYVEGLFAGVGEEVSIETPEELRSGRVTRVDEELCIVRVLGGTLGLNLNDVAVWQKRDIPKFRVGDYLRGQIIDGSGKPLEKDILEQTEQVLPIDSVQMAQGKHLPLKSYLETGITSIDLLLTLFRGQRLAVLAPENDSVLQRMLFLAESIRVPGVFSSSNTSLFLVFAGVGLGIREANYLQELFQDKEKYAESLLVLSRESDSPYERALTPRIAMTAAEYFAHKKKKDVLLIVYGMNAYASAWKESDWENEENSSFDDSLKRHWGIFYERAGCFDEKEGSITLLPVFHDRYDSLFSFAKLSAPMLEGQISLAGGEGSFPVNVLASNSFTMGKRVGRGTTFAQHRQMAEQLRYAYTKSMENQHGDDFDFNSCFEKQITRQRGRHTLTQSETLGWELLAKLPPEKLFFMPEVLRK